MAITQSEIDRGNECEACDTNFREDADKLRARITKLETEIQQLRRHARIDGEIITTLPKCNRLVNGKIVCDKHVVLGMAVWLKGRLLSLRVNAIDDFGMVELGRTASRANYLQVAANNLFDSREAVEAAKK